MPEEKKKSLIFEEAYEEETPPVAAGYILAIGIDQYVHFPKLNNAVRDAQAVVEVLTDKYQFSADHVRTLFDEDATEKKLLREMKYLASEVKEDDNLIIYFSGHGHFDTLLKEGYWIPVDAEPDHIGDYISNATLLTYLRAIPSRHTFLVADSCFSGSLLSETRSVAADRLEELPSRWGLTSGRNEVVLDGPSGSHSPFAKAFLDFLSHNNADKMRISRLIHHVEEVTANNSEQTPIGNRIRNVGDRGGELILKLKTSQPSHYSPPPPRRKVRKKPDPKPVVNTPVENTTSSAGFPKWIFAVVGVLVIGALAAFIFMRNNQQQKKPANRATVEATPTKPSRTPSKTPSSSSTLSTNSAKIIENLKIRIDKGDLTAYKELATAYIKGNGTKVDYKSAVSVLKMGAENGDSESMYLLGRILVEGTHGETKNVRQGESLLLKSANLGNTSAKRYLLAMRRKN